MGWRWKEFLWKERLGNSSRHPNKKAVVWVKVEAAEIERARNWVRYLRKKVLVLVVDRRGKSEGGSLLEKIEWMLHWLREKQAWVRSKI